MKWSLELIGPLREALKKPLPGEMARHVMAPPYRPQLSKEEIAERKPKMGAVLLLLYERQRELHIILTQRKQYEGVHGGQMSFPGGKMDKTDANLVETALRETREEIGVAPVGIEVIGQLSDLYIPPSNFLVHPVVGFAKVINGFKAQEDEVDKIVEIPLSFFGDDKNINTKTEIKLYNGMVVTVPAYVFGNYIIWGATAIMLSEFIYIVKGIEQ